MGIFSRFLISELSFLIFSIMKLFAIRFLGVAMLMICAYAAPLSEERREEGNEMERDNVFKCDTEGEMSSGGHKMKCRRMDSGPNEMQRSWHPTGKVIGNVIGGVVGKLRGGENMMQNGKREGGENMMQNGKRGEEERQCGVTMDCNYGDEEEEKRQGQINEMQNGGEGEEERRKMCMYGPDGTPDETLCQ